MKNKYDKARKIFWSVPLLSLGLNLVHAENSNANPPAFSLDITRSVGDVMPVPEVTFSGSNVAEAPVQTGLRGRIIDDKGAGLPGVSIQIKGTSDGTVTDIDGNYALNVPDGNARLLVSYVGYLAQEVPVNNRSTINITLMPDTKSLEEVVVIGYGTQKRGDITGAVAVMDAKAIEERPIARVDQALIGQMAGVQVQQTSGVPGRAFSIKVRGSGSISAGNEPLYVIDGFPLDVAAPGTTGQFSGGNPLDNINPNDIESIQVLKDASAAAIYGSRGANGVVIITTKTGKSGKPRITLSTYAGWNETTKKLDVLSGEEWIDRAIEMANYNWVNSGPGRTASQTTAERTALLGRFNATMMLDERWLQPGYPGLQIVDWQDEIFRRGIVQNYQVGASGGTDAVNYFVSGDYLNQEGIAIGLDYERYSARTNVEIKPNEKLKFGINLNPTYSITNDPGVEGKDQQMHIAVGYNPVVEASTGLDVNIGDNVPYAWGVSRNSPVRVIENSIGETRIFRSLVSLFGEYNLIDNLRFRSSVNLDHSDANVKNFTPSFVSGQRGNRLAAGNFSGYRRQTFVTEQTLAYDKTFADRHNISTVLGYAYNVGKFNNWRIGSTGGFATDDISTLNAANSIDTRNSQTFTTENMHTLISYFGRVQYNFADRYLLSATIRRDGSSRFGVDTKWGNFPSASVGWRISEESFMDDLEVINNLKLRASWGISGNNFIGNYDHIAALGFSNYTFGNNIATGQVPVNAPNPNLSWEESRTIDVGLDVGVLENRIIASFDYYTKLNTDLLLNIPVPTASGFGTALTNIGEVMNKGWEVELTTRNLTGAFNWTTNLNLSFNKNEVRKLGPNNAPIETGSYPPGNHRLLTIGQPIWSIYVVQQDGILTQADIDNKVPRFGNQVAGDPKFVDANNDGLINDNDRVVAGHPNPDYTWGVTNTFNFKGFDLRVLVQGQNGGHLYSMFGRAMDRPGQGVVENTLGLHRDRWRSAEDPGAGERGKANSSFGFLKSTAWLYESDYWRVRNITLGYDLGSLINNKKMVQGARIYVSAENWFGKDKYAGGFNPEAVNNADNSALVGDDYGAFPLPKALTFGVNLSF